MNKREKARLNEELKAKVRDDAMMARQMANLARWSANQVRRREADWVKWYETHETYKAKKEQP